MSSTVRILVLAASPSDRTALDLDRETDHITTSVRLGQLRDRFDVAVSAETRADQLVPVLLAERPTIVHFAGHATAQEGLLLEAPDGTAQPVDGALLARIVEQLAGVDCVVLNACWSVSIAQALSNRVGCVIGMGREVSDAAATAFSGVFYNSLAEGASLRSAFDLAVSHLELTVPDEASTPQIVSTDMAGSIAPAGALRMRGEIARQLYESEAVALAKSISGLLADEECCSVVEEVFGEFVVGGVPVAAGGELPWLQDRVMTVASERVASGAAAPPHDPTRVLAAIRSLDVVPAQVLLRRYHQNQTDAEIATALGIGAAQVPGMIEQALDHVRRYLASMA
jgi:hypothetical protein